MGLRRTGHGGCFCYIKGLVNQTGDEGTVAGSPMSIRYHFSAHHPLPPGQPRIRL